MDKIAHIYLVYLQKKDSKTPNEKQNTSEENDQGTHTPEKETVSQEDIRRLPAQLQNQTKLYFAFSTLLKSHLLYLLYYTVTNV